MPTDWNKQAALCLDALGTPGFAAALADGIQSVVPYEFTVVFGYIGRDRPLALFDDFTPARRKLHVDEYLEGPYLIDPFFLASIGDTPPGVWRLKEIAPDRFYQGEYYRSYYAQKISSLLVPEKLRQFALPTSLGLFTLAWPRELPPLDNLVETVRADTLGLPHPTRNGFEFTAPSGSNAS